MPRNVIILGGSGSGTIVAETIRDIAAAGGALVPAGYLNDSARRGDRIDGLPVLGGFEDWPAMPADSAFVCAIHRPKLAGERFRRLRSLGIPEERWATVVHPTVVVASSAVVGAGSFLGPHAAVMAGARIGRHASLRAGCYVSHDVDIGDFAFVGPNAVVSGRSRLGEGAHFGPAAACREEISIGAYSIVGLGAVVIDDVPAGGTVFGNPARERP